MIRALRCLMNAFVIVVFLAADLASSDSDFGSYGYSA